MASRRICVLLACVFAKFFAMAGATYCSTGYNCRYYYGELCCPDSICRKRCSNCLYDSHCGRGEECCDGGKCLLACPTTRSPTNIPDYAVWNGGVIASAVISTIVFFAIVISIVVCCCCASCPFYRQRSRGTVMALQPGNQPCMTTTQTLRMQQMQQYPPPGNYNQPPVGYAQPPQQYPSYPQQPCQYPPPPVQGKPPVPPPVSV